MGRKLDLSKLTDEEARHVWEVVQRDFDLRKKEEERLEELKGKIQKESTKKELLSDQAQLNETHCGHCLQPYRFLVNSKRQCLDCHLYTCKKCGSYNRREQGWICDPCQLARVVKTGSLEWYYEHVRARFKRFGSDKVMRSLWGRLHRGPNSSPALGLHRACSAPHVSSGGQFSPIRGRGDSEQTSEDEALAGTEAPRPSREKRLLSVHLFDFDLDSDPPAQSCPQSPQLSPTPPAPDGLQTLPKAPSASVSASQRDAFISHPGFTPESQAFLEEQDGSSPRGSLLGDSSLERKPSPDGEATGSDQPQLQDFADTDTSDEDLGRTPEAAARPACRSKGATWASSQESTARSESQSLGPETLTDADLEEEALKRKLGELTSKVSDKGGSSEEEEEEEEEEEGQSGLIPGRSSSPGTRPIEVQQAGQTHGGENRLPDLEEEVPRTRTPDSALSELEDRVALTTTEVQHAKKEVSDIKSRIAALSAAGLPVKNWEKPRKKSNLQILLLQPSKNSLEDENPEDSEVIKVMSRPHVQKRIFNNSLKLQDRDGGLFNRKSPYRGSLTQRNPNGKNRRVDHIFAKPVMTHQP